MWVCYTELAWYAGVNRCPWLPNCGSSPNTTNFHQNRSDFPTINGLNLFVLAQTLCVCAHKKAVASIEFCGWHLNPSKCKVIVTFRFFGCTLYATKLKSSFCQTQYKFQVYHRTIRIMGWYLIRFLNGIRSLAKGKWLCHRKAASVLLWSRKLEFWVQH